MDWTPWSSCSSSCGPGATRQKSRSFIPGRHGANPEPDKGNSEETQVCSLIPDWPTCPTPARYGSWGNWSSCRQTCYNEGSQSPLTTRSRECTEANLSTNASFNANIATCKDLLLSETKTCGVPLCPGDDKSLCFLARADCVLSTRV